MKKEYVKPYIAVESFQLNAAIASSCSSESKIPLNHYEDTCHNPDGPGYFGDACGSGGGVDMTPPYEHGGDDNDGLCYHGPVTDVSNLFMNS